MKVLVTGATGAIGPRVVHSLHQAGCLVRAFSFDAPTTGMFPPDVEVVVGDVTDEAAVKSAMQGVDAVVHMAALLHIQTFEKLTSGHCEAHVRRGNLFDNQWLIRLLHFVRNDKWGVFQRSHIVNPLPELREKYERVNVGGTATVVEAAIKAGVKRVVLFSTIAVYGPSDGRVLNEMSPTRPDTFYAQTKLAAEEIVLNARGADGQPLGTVLRLGAVYGARIKGNYERLTRALGVGKVGTQHLLHGNLGTRSRIPGNSGHVPRLPVLRFPFIPVGNGLNRRTLVYDRDVGRAAVLAVSHPAAAGRVFNVTDGAFHALNEIIGAICAALGRRVPRFSLPVGPVRIVAGLIETGCRVVGNLGTRYRILANSGHVPRLPGHVPTIPPVTKAMIDKYTEDIAVDGSLIQKELGFVPQYDLKTGWEETVKERRDSYKL